MTQLRVAALAALLLFGASGVTRVESQVAPRGHLLIVGGGEQSDDLVRRFVELAGGPGKARIAVVPMASEEAQASGDEKAEQLREFGADAVVLNLTRAEAEAPAVSERLAGITGVWFTGGDQARLAPLLYDTPALAAIQGRYRAGAVIGGTSAGAAIMSDSMLTGNQRRPDSLGYYGDDYPAIARGTIEVVRGLGFLHGAIVDQHFIRRERHNRLLSVILERPSLIGVGIDEGTALEISADGKWKVVGASAVVIYDARAARVTRAGAQRLGASGIRLQILPSGSSYDPRTGRAVLSTQ
ncbi:MAG: cyanophycinase [Gemmatimonadota bacterium]